MRTIVPDLHGTDRVVQLEVIVEAVEEGDEELVGVLLLVARHVIQFVPHCIQQMRWDERVSAALPIEDRR